MYKFYMYRSEYGTLFGNLVHKSGFASDNDSRFLPWWMGPY